MNTNKWTINQDGYAMWVYHFPIIELNKRGKDYLDIVENLLLIGENTKFFLLQKEPSAIIAFPSLLSDFIKHLKALQSKSKFYPTIDSHCKVDQLVDGEIEFFFSSRLKVYDRDGKIVEREMWYGNIREVLDEINNSLNKTGISPPVGLIISPVLRKDSNGPLEVTSYYFSFTLNSDIWANLVPCSHCPQNWTGEELRNQGGLQAVNKFWYDNRELAQLNVKILNDFMTQMLEYVKGVGGYCELNEGGLSIYEGIFTETGIIQK